MIRCKNCALKKDADVDVDVDVVADDKERTRAARVAIHNLPAGSFRQERR